MKNFHFELFSNESFEKKFQTLHVFILATYIESRNALDKPIIRLVR